MIPSPPERRAVPALVYGRDTALNSSLSRRELALYMAVVLAIATTRIVLAGGPQFSNDSYQYLSVVENLRDRGSLFTSIVHFDTERASGRVPAPATTFPPGYPLAIWALSWTRLPPEWVGLFFSLVCAIAVLPLMRVAASGVGLRASATRRCLLVWALSAQVALYATSILAEAAFTAASLGAVVLLIRADDARAGKRRPSLALAYLLVALSCWLRYAGLLFVAAFHVHAAFRMRRDRERLASWARSLLLCDAVVGALLARNIAHTGTWRGGNERQLRNGLGYVLHRLGDAAYELTLGSIQKPVSLAYALFAALAIAGVLAALVMVTRSRIDSLGTPTALSLDRARPLLWCVGVYCAGMCYLGFTTQISLGARMFVPVLPEVLLVAGLVWSGIRESKESSRAWSLVASSLLAVGFLGGNLFSLARRPRSPGHRTVADSIALPTRSGVPLSTWMETSIPRDAVVFAVDGQATGYALRRKTVSAIGRKFTTATWGEAEVRQTMSRFGAEFLIVYPQIAATGGLDSEFLRRLARRAPPRWLHVAAENPRVLIYRSLSLGSPLGSP